MKILRKKIQIWKVLQKIHIKHMSHPSKKFFQKNTKFWEFLRCGSPGQEKPSGDLKMDIFSLKPKLWEVTWFFSTYLYLKTHPQICFNNNFDILSFLYLIPRGWGNSVRRLQAGSFGWGLAHVLNQWVIF